MYTLISNDGDMTYSFIVPVGRRSFSLDKLLLLLDPSTDAGVSFTHASFGVGGGLEFLSILSELVVVHLSVLLNEEELLSLLGCGFLGLDSGLDGSLHGRCLLQMLVHSSVLFDLLLKRSDDLSRACLNDLDGSGLVLELLSDLLDERFLGQLSLGDGGESCLNMGLDGVNHVLRFGIVFLHMLLCVGIVCGMLHRLTGGSFDLRLV